MKKLVLKKRARVGGAEEVSIVLATAEHSETIQALGALRNKLQEALVDWDQTFVTLSDDVSFELVDQATENSERRTKA